MPKMNWGIEPSTIDDFDRSKQFRPYSGPIPPLGVYAWQLKVLKTAAKTREKNPQLRIGLELVPREDYDEDKYAGYFVMTFRTITPNNEFTYVPFCDAIGVSGRDFTDRTITDAEGNVKRIGKWQNTGEELVLAQLIDSTNKDGEARRDIGWIGAYEEDEELDPDEEEYADEDGEEPF